MSAAGQARPGALLRPGPSDIERSVASLGEGDLAEHGLSLHVAPLFARVLGAAPGRIYLANHSLGRPLDAMDDDVREGLAAWYDRMGGAWDAWMAESANVIGMTSCTQPSWNGRFESAETIPEAKLSRTIEQPA